MTATAIGPSVDLLLDINAAFNARDVDRIMSFFEEDATFLMARGPEPGGLRVHGETLNYQGCDIYEFCGRKILNKDTYWKTVEQKDRL
jgi:hypothetical protein